MTKNRPTIAYIVTVIYRTGQWECKTFVEGDAASNYYRRKASAGAKTLIVNVPLEWPR